MIRTEQVLWGLELGRGFTLGWENPGEGDDL